MTRDNFNAAVNERIVIMIDAFDAQVESQLKWMFNQLVEETAARAMHGEKNDDKGIYVNSGLSDHSHKYLIQAVKEKLRSTDFTLQYSTDLSAYIFGQKQ